MHIRKARIRNYRSLRELDIDFNEHLNIVVGDNETGKSTLLEAINLALTGLVDGRPVQLDVHPFLSFIKGGRS
jgi:predicted ATP-dependent endonuclease of OLD family